MLDAIPELAQIARLDAVKIGNMFSDDIRPHHWNIMASSVPMPLLTVAVAWSSPTAPTRFTSPLRPSTSPLPAKERAPLAPSSWLALNARATEVHRTPRKTSSLPYTGQLAVPSPLAMLAIRCVW